MNLADLIQTWGYGAVFAGALLEGETLLLLGGFAAHRGHLSLPLVIGVAVLGSFIGDQFYFQLGRRGGARLLARFPRLAPGAARVHALLERHHLPIILSLRFLYGLRTVG
ncbi:MAG: DedA family protein, partial [Burkholderiales bacterium]